MKSVEEASQECQVPCEVILEFIQEEWVGPADPQGPALDEEDLARIRLIWDLREELGVNAEAIPIILQLVDQLNRLHLEIQHLLRPTHGH